MTRTIERAAGAAAHNLPEGAYTMERHRPQDVPEAAAERRIRAAMIEVRDVDVARNLRELSGLAVPYNVPADIGPFLEEFAPGSLARSIDEAPAALPLLLFHDSQAFPIGRAVEWDETDAGLMGLWALEADEVAQRAAQLARSGSLPYLSIRFQPVRSEWSYAEEYKPDLGPKFKDHVRRTEARLLETSLVSTPAYGTAAVSFVRTGENRRARSQAATGRRVDAWRTELDELRGT